MSDASESPPVEEKKGEKPVETGEEPKPQEGEEQKPATPSIETKAYEWLSAGTSWGTSWLATAKEKTLSTMELVKKDLSEFSDVMAHEAQAIASATKENVQKQAQFVQQLVSPEEEQAPTVGEAETPAESSTKKPVAKSDSGFGWMKGFVDTIKSLAVEETTKGEEDITETIRPRVHRSTTLSTVRLHEIATSEATFLDAPEGDDAAAFEEFAKKFRMEEYDAEMSSLLATNPPMRLVYSNLVPSQVDNFAFWTRYFFKVEQAELNEQLKNSLTRELVVDVNPTADEGKKAAVKEDGAKRERKGSEASPSSDDSLSVVSSSTNTQNASPQTDETWSICSKEDEATHEDADEKEDKDKGLLTPKAEDKGEWVDWDE